MARLMRLAGVALIASTLIAAAPSKKLTLPDSEVAVAMAVPVLPARITGDCLSSDVCEFGTKWRVCEAVPLYRDARDGSPLLRMLKADEEFVARRAEIELIAPGEVEMLVANMPEQTGGLALPKGAKLVVYGPTPGPRAIYFDLASGKGWSPPTSDDFLQDNKIAKLTRAPAVTWWVNAKLNDGMSGWLQLKSVPDLRIFPMFYHAEAILTWDIDRLRDDETPGCAVLLENMKSWLAK